MGTQDVLKHVLLVFCSHSECTHVSACAVFPAWPLRSLLKSRVLASNKATKPFSPSVTMTAIWVTYTGCVAAGTHETMMPATPHPTRVQEHYHRLQADVVSPCQPSSVSQSGRCTRSVTESQCSPMSKLNARNHANTVPQRGLLHAACVTPLVVVIRVVVLEVVVILLQQHESWSAAPPPAPPAPQKSQRRASH